MRIVVAPQARADLRDAYEAVSRDDPEVAERLLARLAEVIGLLATEAFIGPEVVLKDGRYVRSWPVPPYRIYYRQRPDVFEVVRIYHQARRSIEG